MSQRRSAVGEQRYGRGDLVWRASPVWATASVRTGCYQVTGIAPKSRQRRLLQVCGNLMPINRASRLR